MTRLFDRAMPSSQQPDRVVQLLLMMAGMGALLVFLWFNGSTDRVTYLGPDLRGAQTANEVYVKTEPYGIYILEPDDGYRALKAGCRYDLTYSPTFGRNKGDTPGLRTKYVRSARLVDCP